MEKLISSEIDQINNSARLLKTERIDFYMKSDIIFLCMDKKKRYVLKKSQPVVIISHKIVSVFNQSRFLTELNRTGTELYLS